MIQPPEDGTWTACRWLIPRIGIIVLLGSLRGSTPAEAEDWFDRFLPPAEWQTRFWTSPDAVALRQLEPQALAHLVPTQAGLRYCRCPDCGAAETTDPLAWSLRQPDQVVCRQCAKSFPNDSVPAKDKDKKIPEDAIEVVPGVIHKYPYHVPDPEAQRRPDERLYIQARRDFEAREYLAKTAFYAAVRHHLAPAPAGDPQAAQIAAVLILRFAQVYPRYALHLDQPGQPKYLEPANQPPPYRLGYRTAKWDCTGSLDVPINLVLAYALIRDTPALAAAAKLLDVPRPTRTIEDELFRASALFSEHQPIEIGEQALQVDRGLLAVGRLLDDQALLTTARARLDTLAERGFFHDGLWRAGDAPTHRRVLALLDGWITPLLAGTDRARGDDPRSTSGRAGADLIPMVTLARSAGALASLEGIKPEVERVAWPPVSGLGDAAGPALLGGAGLARLSVGQGADALDVELRGMGSFGPTRSRRQAIRVAVGGRTVLGDLDDASPRPDGWDRSSASHNTVLVDGLNQRETPRLMREAAPGGDFLFFAADPDFQVAVLDDPWAYPLTLDAPGGYRQTLVACSDARTRYAVAVFEVRGGSRHDQIFHGPPTLASEWRTSVPTTRGPKSLLDPAIPYLPTASAADGRWFVQALGAFDQLQHGPAGQPAVADWLESGRPSLRLHLLGDAPYEVITGSTPRDPAADEPTQAALLVRRQAQAGVPFGSTFVTVFDPATAGGGKAGSLLKVGRMTDSPGFVVLYLETVDGPEHLVINLRPGTQGKTKLADGRELTTDGRVVRARRDELMLAGGTVASLERVAVRQPKLLGKITGASRFATADSRGWFETDAPLPAPPTLVGRTLLIRHGDGTTHGWTVHQIEPRGDQTRLHVREEPGFTLEGKDAAARYYQFPNTVSPGPHIFTISRIAR